MIFVDSNLLIDFLDVGKWAEWSRHALSQAQGRGPLAVAPVVRAETAGRFTSVEEQSEYLADLAIDTLPIDPDSAFRAGQAHRAYKQRGGVRAQSLPISSLAAMRWD